MRPASSARDGNAPDTPEPRATTEAHEAMTRGRYITDVITTESGIHPDGLSVQRERAPYTSAKLEHHDGWSAVNGVSPVIGPLNASNFEERE